MKSKFLAFAAAALMFASCDDINQLDVNLSNVGPTIHKGFSVSPNKKVKFAPGNLQYNYTNKKWQFAEKQYSIVGTDNSTNIQNKTGIIDLFGWGDTGDDSDPKVFKTSNNNSSYTWNDWGTAAAADLGEGWFTLTVDEWKYLFSTRNNAASLFGEATVEGQKGMILLPDEDVWILPTGLTFKPSSYKMSFADNIYDAKQWEAMEAAGAVFLPAAGCRFGTTDVDAVDSYGRYWYSTDAGPSEARYLYFKECYYYYESRFTGRYIGHSVRLASILPKEEPAAPKGFSVSDAKKVKIAKGNLQYNYTDKKWQFAENQYSIVGTDNSTNIQNKTGIIDLFGWGDTGDDSDPKVFKTSINSRDYTWNDWGTAVAADLGEGWFTLTADEWKYLFTTRDYAASLFGLATVTGQKGLIVFPDIDAEILVALMNFKSGSKTSYADNIYDIAKWKVLEAVGAVFLPAAGNRAANTVSNVGVKGGYWSSSEDYANYAHFVSFRDGSIDAAPDGTSRGGGLSVRLAASLSD